MGTVLAMAAAFCFGYAFGRWVEAPEQRGIHPRPSKG